MESIDANESSAAPEATAEGASPPETRGEKPPKPKWVRWLVIGCSVAAVAFVMGCIGIIVLLKKGVDRIKEVDPDAVMQNLEELGEDVAEAVGETVDAAIAQADADGDGKISADELPAAIPGLLSAVGKNLQGDGEGVGKLLKDGDLEKWQELLVKGVQMLARGKIKKMMKDLPKPIPGLNDVSGISLIYVAPHRVVQEIRRGLDLMLPYVVREQVKASPATSREARQILFQFGLQSLYPGRFVWPLYEVVRVDGVDTTATLTLDATANAWWRLHRGGKPNATAVDSREVLQQVINGADIEDINVAQTFFDEDRRMEAIVEGPNMLMYLADLLRMRGKKRSPELERDACVLVHYWLTNKTGPMQELRVANPDQRLAAEVVKALADALDAGLAEGGGASGARVLDEVVQVVTSNKRFAAAHEAVQSASDMSAMSQRFLVAFARRDRNRRLRGAASRVSAGLATHTRASRTLAAAADAWWDALGGRPEVTAIALPGIAPTPATSRPSRAKVGGIGPRILQDMAGELCHPRRPMTDAVAGESCTLVARYLRHDIEQRESGDKEISARSAMQIEERRLAASVLDALAVRLLESDDDTEAVDASASQSQPADVAPYEDVVAIVTSGLPELTGEPDQPPETVPAGAVPESVPGE